MRTGLYEHYKGKQYEVLGVVKHSETLQDLVLYKTLYQNDLSELWVRPKEMFEENVIIDGEEKPRFKYIGK